jgi:hypothetical protein
MRTLEVGELEMVTGGFQWNELSGAVVTGAIAGGLVSMNVYGAVGGGLIGGISYLVSDIWLSCF